MSDNCNIPNKKWKIFAINFKSEIFIDILLNNDCCKSNGKAKILALNNSDTHLRQTICRPYCTN